MKAVFSRGGIKSAVFLLIFAITAAFCANSQTPVVTSTPDRIDFAIDTLEQIEPVETPEEASKTDVSLGYRAGTTVRTQTNTAVRTNYISILGRTIDLFVSNDTSINAGSKVARFISGNYNGQFYYGHNSSNVFAGLANLPIGSTFTINLDGINYTYRVENVVTVPNDEALAKNMKYIARANYDGRSYDISLMTCAGTPYGNGNATHRTILFANNI